MRIKINIILVLIYSSIFLSSCLSISTMQSGKTLGEDVTEVVIGGSYGKFSHNSLGLDSTENDNLPVFSLRGQYGISDKVDVGINIDHLLFVGASCKWQFIGDSASRFASSVGLDVGFNLLYALPGIYNLYMTVPLYVSYDINKNICIYVTPRYLTTSLYTHQRDNSGINATGSYTQFGYSVGLLLGSYNKFAIEISNYSRDLYKPTVLSVGYLFKL